MIQQKYSHDTVETIARKIHLTSQTLHQFVIDLHLPEIQTLDALLVQMTGDYVASRMLARILYWRDKAIKFGGWVWKSWRDWRAECGLSQGQIKRVHRDGVLEQYGMARSLMKVNGAPTTHYLLDEDAFISKLADFLSMAFDEVKLRLSIIAGGSKVSSKKKSRKGDAEYGNIIEPSVELSTAVQPLFQMKTIHEIITEATGLTHEQLAPFDENKLKTIWQEFTYKAHPPFFNAYAKSNNDLILHAFMGVPVEQAIDEMGRRSKGQCTKQEPHRNYQIYLEHFLQQHE